MQQDNQQNNEDVEMVAEEGKQDDTAGPATNQNNNEAEQLSQKTTWKKWKMQLDEKVQQAKKKNKTQMNALLDFLLTIDKTLSENQELELLMDADELFNSVFKITYYDDPDHSICNTPLTQLSTQNPPLPHAEVLEAVEDLVMP